MYRWFTKRTRLEKLEEQYSELMKKSFKVALIDASESEKVQQRAYEVYIEIKHLTQQRVGK